MKRIRIAALFGAMAVLCLTGCAPKTQWSWNQYKVHLWDYYSQEVTEEEYLNFLLGAEEEAKKTGKRLAPGIAAEIGTQYVRMGRLEDGLAYYKLEKETWPVSEPFMTSLIDGLKHYDTQDKMKPSNRKVPKSPEDSLPNSESAIKEDAK